jgi:hypothetical protein
LRSISLLLLALLLVLGPGGHAVCFAPPATASTTKSAAADPRQDLAMFFDAVRRGDQASAFDCWDNDIAPLDQRAYVEDLVRHLMREMIAGYRLEQALSAKLPEEYDKARRAGRCTPTPEELAAAQFTSYRRLAIVKWGAAEDAGFPMVLDSRDQSHPRWKISMQQWYATNHSSVGDSMLMSGWGAEAKDLTAKEILDGNLRTIESVQLAYVRHMNELAKAAHDAAPAHELEVDFVRFDALAGDEGCRQRSVGRRPQEKRGRTREARRPKSYFHSIPKTFEIGDREDPFGRRVTNVVNP